MMEKGSYVPPASGSPTSSPWILAGNEINPPARMSRSGSPSYQKNKVLANRDKESLLDDIITLKRTVQEQSQSLQRQKIHTAYVESENRKLEKDLEELELHGNFKASRTGNTACLRSKLQGLKTRLGELQATCESQQEELFMLRRDLRVTRMREIEVERDMFLEEVGRSHKILKKLKNSHNRLSLENKQLSRYKDRAIQLDTTNQRLDSTVTVLQENLEKANKEAIEYRQKAKDIALRTKKCRENYHELETKNLELEKLLESERTEKQNLEKEVYETQAKKCEEMEAQNSLLEKTVEEARLEKETLEKLVEDERIEKQKLEKLVEDGRNEVMSLKKLLEEERTEKQSLEKLVEDGRTERQNLEMLLESERIEKQNLEKLVEIERNAKGDLIKLVEDQRMEKQELEKTVESERIEKLNSIKLMEDERLEKLNLEALVKDERIEKQNLENQVKIERIEMDKLVEDKKIEKENLEKLVEDQRMEKKNLENKVYNLNEELQKIEKTLEGAGILGTVQSPRTHSDVSGHYSGVNQSDDHHYDLGQPDIADHSSDSSLLRRNVEYNNDHHSELDEPYDKNQSDGQFSSKKAGISKRSSLEMETGIQDGTSNSRNIKVSGENDDDQAPTPSASHTNPATTAHEESIKNTLFSNALPSEEHWNSDQDVSEIESDIVSMVEDEMMSEHSADMETSHLKRSSSSPSP